MFLLWPPRVWAEPPTPPGLRLLRLSAALVVAASLAVGTRAFVQDLRVAFVWAWPRAVPPSVQSQIETTERGMPPDAALLVVFYAGSDSWYARMWQRVLYPRTVVLLPSDRMTGATIARLRSRYHLQYAVAIGSPPADPGFVRPQDLGDLPGGQFRVWFGELSP